MKKRTRKKRGKEGNKQMEGDWEEDRQKKKEEREKRGGRGA